MNPNNDICQFYLRKKCRYGDECFKKHERQSYSKRDDDIPILTFKVAAKSDEKNVQQILTDKPTAHDAALDSTKNVNEIHPEKSTNAPINQDFNDLKRENKKLIKLIKSFEKKLNTLNEQMKQQENEKVKIYEEFNSMRLDDENYKCPICFELFINPLLMNCSHMFCEMCIDKWLMKNNKCPICQVKVNDFSLCLNMHNFINRMVEQMPKDVQMDFKILEESRSVYEPKSVLLNSLFDYE